MYLLLDHVLHSLWKSAENYGEPMPDEGTKRILTVQEKMAVLAGFAWYVLMYRRQKGKTHCSVAHAERAVSVVKTYYRGRNKRASGTGATQTSTTT